MNRNNRTARRALVARVESLEGRISLSTVGTTITRITNYNQYTLSPYTFPSNTTGGGGTTITRNPGTGYTLSGFHF